MIFDILFPNKKIFGLNFWGAALGALAGGIGGYLGSKKSPNVGEPLKPYSGYKPPHVEYLRPVEKQITDILMRRSMGQGMVGLGGDWASQKMKQYDLAQKRALEQKYGDIQNQLSGMGLSRNLAATQALKGRAQEIDQEQRQAYGTAVDIEDLQARREDINKYSEMLRQQNMFNFQQEDVRADFEKAVWAQEQANELRRRGLQVDASQLYESPMGSAVSSAADLGLSAYALGQLGQTSKPTSRAFGYTDPTLWKPSGSEYFGRALPGEKQREMALKRRANLPGLQLAG